MEATVNLDEYGVTIHAPSIRKFTRDGHQYVALPHNSEYSISLSNQSNRYCDATVMTDGHSVGTFRINPYNSVHVERPLAHDKRFVFLKENTSMAREAGLIMGRSQNGLVSVTFSPEKRNDDRNGFRTNNSSPCDDMNQFCSLGFIPRRSSNSHDHPFESQMSTNCFGHERSTYNYSSGATALGDHSDQIFGRAKPLSEIDYYNQRTINLRLVVDEIDEWPIIRRNPYNPYNPYNPQSHLRLSHYDRPCKCHYDHNELSEQHTHSPWFMWFS
jgi:hypothetical protein